MGDPAYGTQLREKPPENQLDSWKEIAAYLNRDVTTVQRWERRERMPVHRHLHDKRGSVYALPSELDAWRQSRQPRLEDENGAQADLPLPIEDHPTRVALRARWLGVAAFAVLAVIAISYIVSRGRTERTARPNTTSLASSRTIDPEAHDEYLRGRSVLAGGPGHLSRLASKRQYTEQDVQTAIAYFKSAIDKNPAYAQAYAGLADAYIHLGNPGWGGRSPQKSLFDAKEAATTALKLDPSLPEGHFSLAQTLQYDWNWPEAEKEYRLALKLNPNYVDAHLEYGRFVQALGRNDEALTQMHYADELDPFNIDVKEIEAWVTYASRQYDLALKQFESLGDYGGLIHAYREKGMYPMAIAFHKRCVATHPSQSRDPYALAVLASIYGLQGRNDEAEALITALKETARHRYVSGFFFAEAYVGLGQRDQAITWLEQAYEEHDQWMVFANSYPGLDRLHSEPRFQALLRRMNFPPAP